MISVKSLKDRKLAATDGEIGHVHDLYFDDCSWTIRYVVADTGGFLRHKRVLLNPADVGSGETTVDTLPVHLDQKTIENSPDVGSDLPVSRQQEEVLAAYYAWPHYWTGLGTFRVAPVVTTELPDINQEESYVDPIQEDVKARENDIHLRSCKEVEGYRIEASDGEIGHVEDFFCDPEAGYIIRYLKINTHNWLPGGKHVLLAPDWCRAVDWAAKKVRVDATCDQIRNSPEYDGDGPPLRDYEESLYRHYGQSPYWRI